MCCLVDDWSLGDGKGVGLVNFCWDQVKFSPHSGHFQVWNKLDTSTADITCGTVEQTRQNWTLARVTHHKLGH